jgi:hypothetical protein
MQIGEYCIALGIKEFLKLDFQMTGAALKSEEVVWYTDWRFGGAWH